MGGACTCTCKDGFSGDKCENSGVYSHETHNRCGESWSHALTTCVTCPDGWSCPSGQTCFGGVEVGYCPNSRRSLEEDTTLSMVTIVTLMAISVVVVGSLCVLCCKHKEEEIVCAEENL